MDTLVDDFARAVAGAITTESFLGPDLLSDFAGSVKDRALERLEHHGSNDAEFKRLELEARMWTLAEVLSRREEVQSVAEVLRSWLQEGLPRPERPSELASIKWMATRDRLRHTPVPLRGPDIVSVMVNELDVDAPVRQGKQIAPEDAAADATVFRYVFNLLQAGEDVEASRVCAQTGNWTLKAAVDAPKSCNVIRALYALCQTASLSKYERAAYGFLCGDVSSVLALSSDWETQLLAHVNAIVVASARKLGSRSTAGGLADPPPAPSLDEGLEAVDSSVDHKVSLQGQDVLRVVIKGLIRGNIDSMATELVDHARRAVLGNTDDHYLLGQPWLLRILLHLELFVPTASNSTVEFLIRAYVEFLSLPEQPRFQLIPAYIRLIDDAEQRTAIYARVIAQISDPGERMLQLDASQRFGIDIRPVVRQVFRLVELNVLAKDDSPEVARIDGPLGSTQAADANALYLVTALEWFSAAKMWDDAVGALCTLFHSVLLRGLPRAALEIGERMRLGLVYGRSAIQTPHRAELLEFSKIVTALNHIMIWDSLSRDGVAWRTRATEAVGHVIQSVNTAMSFMESVGTAEGRRLRQIYVPFLVLELLRILIEAREANLRYAQIALEIAILVADPERPLWPLFRATDQLDELNERLRQSAIQSLDLESA